MYSLNLLTTKQSIFEHIFNILECLCGNTSIIAGKSDTKFKYCPRLRKINFRFDIGTKKKSKGNKSGERAGHFNGARLPIRMPGYI